MLRRPKFEANMAREIEFHLEEATQEYIARGLSPREARLRARREFGPIDLAKEEVRDTQRLQWIADFLRDARFTLLTWRRNPGFAAGVLAVLALGMGSATALFSVLDRVLFRPLPYANPGRLVSFGEVLPTYGEDSPLEVMRDRAYFQFWKPAPATFESVTSILGRGRPCDLTEERPERLHCAQVESNFLDVLGVPVVLGRNFTAEEDRMGGPPVAIISHALWLRRFGGDARAAGRMLQIDDNSVQMIGVLPADFESPIGEPDVLLPQQLPPIDPNQKFGGRFFTTIGRLRPGVTTQQAVAAIAPVIDAGTRLFPPLIRPVRARVRNLRDLQVSDASRMAWLLFAATGVFLAIVCVNTTGLLLARLAARSREFEMRAALGASKARLARMAFAESILFAISAGGLGMFFSWALLKVFLRLAPASIPRIEHASLDLRVFAVAAVLSLLCGVAIGLWPALSSLRVGTPAGGRSTSGLSWGARLALIGTQVALTVALLGTSGLVLHSLLNLVRVPLGFQSEQTLTMTVNVRPAHYPNAQSQSALFEQVLVRLRAAPGTIAASWSSAPPLDSFIITTGFPVDGAAAPREAGMLRIRFITPGYMETFRIPILKGRTFLETDRDGRPAAILSQAAARILFPGQNAVGHTVKPLSAPWHEVVGVAADIRSSGLLKDGEAEVYLIRNRRTGAMRSGTLTLRTALTTTDATELLKQSLASVDPQLPADIKTVTEEVAGLTARPRFLAALLAAFAGLALFVVAVGLYAVASFLVTQRTRDIGIRIALGASGLAIAKQLAGEAIYWIAAGTALGYGLAQMAARALTAELFNVPATDAWSWASTVGVLAISLLLALITPALRAMRLDPAVALRAE